MLAPLIMNLFLPSIVVIPETVTVQVLDGKTLVYSVVVSGENLTYQVIQT